MSRTFAVDTALGILTRSERRGAAGLALLSLVGAVVETIGIGAVMPLMALITDPAAVLADPRARALLAWTGFTSVDRFVLWSTAALLGLFVIKNLYLAALYFAQARFVCDVETRLGSELLRAYLFAPFVERVEQNSADRIRIITGEVGRLTAGYLLPLAGLLAEALVATGLMALLFFVNPAAALLALALIAGTGVLVHAGFRRRIGREREIRVETLSGMFRAVSESLGALKETKVLCREQFFVQRFASNSQRYARATEVFTTLGMLPRLVVETASVAALAIAIAVAVRAQYPLAQLIPVLTVVGLAAIRIMPSAARMLSAINNLRYFTPAVHAVAAGLAQAPAPLQVASVTAGGAHRRRMSELLLRDVYFRYPGADRDALRGVNLRLRRGEILALAGPSGSGKTTLSDVFLGLLTPTSGEILVDGERAGALHMERPGFAGLVPQVFYVLDDTVRRNVAFGLPDESVDEGRVWKALAMARLEDRVRCSAEGLAMPVGENGALLSGGERQRLAIARTLYHDPDVLVFDEATSALDTFAEAEIARTISELAADKLVIVIAHRPVPLQIAERIILLEEGSQVAEGTYRELASSDRRVRSLLGTGD